MGTSIIMQNGIHIQAVREQQAGFRQGPLLGKGLFFEPRRLSADRWREWCATARSWGMTWVHPMVGRGRLLLYTEEELLSVGKEAHLHGLQIAPYLEVLAESLEQPISQQASLVAYVASVFGVACLKFGREWENSLGVTWVRELGSRIRQLHEYDGLILPILLADIGQRDSLGGRLLFQELLKWTHGWMPFVPARLWQSPNQNQNRSANSLYTLLTGQWQEQSLAELVVDAQLPILSLDGNTYDPAPPEEEVGAWCELVEPQTGYCGFWYDERVRPYSSVIAASGQGSLLGLVPTVQIAGVRDSSKTTIAIVDGIGPITGPVVGATVAVTTISEELPIVSSSGALSELLQQTAFPQQELPGESQEQVQGIGVATLERERGPITPLPETVDEPLEEEPVGKAMTLEEMVTLFSRPSSPSDQLTPIPPTLDVEQEPESVSQEWSQTDLLAVWHKIWSDLPWDDSSPICQEWAAQLKRSVEGFPGSPRALPFGLVEGRTHYTILQCEYGAIFYNRENGRVFVC